MITDRNRTSVLCRGGDRIEHVVKQHVRWYDTYGCWDHWVSGAVHTRHQAHAVLRLDAW